MDIERIFNSISAKNQNTRIHVTEPFLEGHLKRLADYVELGENVWWIRDGDWLEFYDGDDQPNTREEGPIFMSFETHDLQDVYKMLKHSWEQCKQKGYDHQILDLLPGK